MDAEERREASRAFSDALREKVAASREGVRLEDLVGTGRGKGESTIVEREDEEGGRG